VLEERDWAGKYIPIVRVVGNEWDVAGEMVTSGLVRNAKDPMRMINYYTSHEAEFLALAPKAPFMVTPEQVQGFEDMYR
ncbi:portal protein, partial [Escherichia coli]|uniref:portal protein n=1 Tax=Escherichia coli TaxID=562 RepID=UPI003D067F02